MTSFVHLKCHSEYSITDGIVRIPDLIKHVKNDQMMAVAISDDSNLFSLVKFYRKAIAAGVKPIISADLWIYENKEKYRITCYCQNEIGYKNLTRLMSRAYVEGQIDDKPTIRWQWLEESAEGLIVLSGGRYGDVGQALLSRNTTLAKKRIKRWCSVFGDRFYLELQRTNREGEADYNHAAIDLAQAFNVPVVATNDVCFLVKEDFDAHEARVCIQSGYVLDDPKRPRRYSPVQYLRTQEEMTALFSDIPEALENTVEIAKRCTLELSLGTPFLPNFPVPDGVSLEEYLEVQAHQKLIDYFHLTPEITEEQQKKYQNRLNLELQVINSMGFPGYFLIVSDFISWARLPIPPPRLIFPLKTVTFE